MIRPENRSVAADPFELRRALDVLDFFAGMAEAEIRREARRAQRGKVLPVLLVGGFLGSGKTTLMQRLLTGDHGLRLTAIVNDVAEINIDAKLIERAGRNTVALANGCVCCSQSGELARTLSELSKTATETDAIVVETSGVADLWALAQIVKRVEGCLLDGVVTVLDAANPPTKQTHSLIARQLAAADIGLINKAELASPDQLADAEELAAKYMPSARLIQTTGCSVPTEVLLGTLDLGNPKIKPDLDEETQFSDDLFSTLSFEAEGPVDRQLLEHCLATLPCPVIRMKGIVQFSHDPNNAWALHQVANRRDLTVLEVTVDRSCLVIIGLRKTMFREALVESLQGTGFFLMK